MVRETVCECNALSHPLAVHLPEGISAYFPKLYFAIEENQIVISQPYEGGKMNLEIIYEDDTELAEFEALGKGYRGDIIVKIGDKKYKVYVISMIRLQQDFEKIWKTQVTTCRSPTRFL